MTVYFDNSATTRPSAAVVAAVVDMCVDCYGNSSSSHSLGIKAEAKITESKAVVSMLLDVSPDELIFTSGGTEANNTAVFGIAESFKRSGKHIITTKVEHPSVTSPVKLLEQRGYEITYLDVCESGHINTEILSASVRPDTILVSVQHINSETGAIQNIAELAKAVKSKNAGAIFHSDGVQAFGKIPVNLKNIDLYSISGHKIHGIKGIGCLYIKKDLKIFPLIYGGEHQKGLRAGTENSMGVAAFAVAAKEAYDLMDTACGTVLAVKKRLAEIADGEYIVINGNLESDSPYILNMSFFGKKGEILLRCLDENGVYVSTGTACNERKKNGSVLTYYGYSKDRVSSAVRFSFSRFNTLEEAEYCVSALDKALRRLA